MRKNDITKRSKKIIKSTEKRLKSSMRRALDMNIDEKLNSNDEYDVSNSNTKKKNYWIE